MNGRRIALLAAIVALAGCNKNPPTSGESATTTSAASAAASAQVAAAPAPAASGPIIPPQPVARPTDAQRQAGATLASQGGGGNVAACSTCHGASGEGNAQMSSPRLAGQAYAYLLHELESYAGDARTHPVMAPIAKAMTADQRAAAAAYFASLGTPAGAATAAASEPAMTSTSGTRQAGGNDRGRQLAMLGDETKLVQACANCHGPEGIGTGSAYPYLAGQHASYLAATLAAWRDGTRHNDPSGQMPVIAKSLDDAAVQAVVAYYAQLPPPPPRDADAGGAPAPATASASAVVSGPRGAAQPPQGVGTQQGALTGGAQGPGGAGQVPGTEAGAAAPASAASR